MVTFDESKQKKQLDELRKKEEEKLIEMLSVKYGIPYIDLSIVPINSRALTVTKENTAKESSLAVFDIVGKKIKVAIFSPNNDKTQEELSELGKNGYKIDLYMASHAGLEHVWERYKDVNTTQKTEAGVLSISGDEIENTTNKFKNIVEVGEEIKEVLKSKEIHRVSKVFEVILGGAITLGVSDIHTDPQEDSVRLRYRLDGILQDVSFLDHKTYHLLMSRIKLLSGLKLNVTSDTQDGRFSIKIKDANIEIRTSILPGPYAEAAVLRILNPKSISVPLEELGIEQGLLEILHKEVKRPHGMILNTGPTGSGKTTTLYAFLRKIYNSEIKIITIEDPIEYHISGVTQTQVDAKTNYTFLSGLRAALRQDPDVIMIGEIRDGETAKIAVNSALTGHLVLSTLHTNTAAGAIPRLIDLGVDPKVLSSALNIAIAQRLVRKLCATCKEKYTPSDRELKIVSAVIESAKKKRADMDLNFNLSEIWKAKGCEKCNNTGYKGRIGIYEAIKMDKSIEAILKENPNEQEIKEVADGQGILDMKEDGIIKVLKGVTTIKELDRVIELDYD